MVQAFIVLFSHVRRSAPNGATLHRLVSILGGQIFISPLLGNKTMFHMTLRHFPDYVFARETFAVVIGVAVLLYSLRCAPVELKLFVLFCFAVLSLSLARPIPGHLPEPQWELMCFPGHGNRYYFLPSIGFLAALVWVAIGGSRVPRYVAALLLLLWPIGIVRDWRYPDFVDLHFRKYASQFRRYPSGETIVIPINPVNDDKWKMELTKH
jgi:hypothetical protein